MFENLSNIQDQAKIVERLKNIIIHSSEDQMENEGIVLYGGRTDKKIELAIAFAKDFSNQLGHEYQEIVFIGNEKTIDISRILTVAPSGVLIFNNIEALSKETFSFLIKALQSQILNIKFGNGPASREIKIDLPKFISIFILESEYSKEYDWASYSFKIEYNYQQEAEYLISNFLTDNSLSASEQDIHNIIINNHDLISLRRTLIELRDIAFSKNSSCIKYSWISNEYNNITIQTVDEIESGHDFELFSADLLRKNGFSEVTVTKASCDFGIDIFAIKDEIRYAIQCKRYNSQVGIEAVQQVLGSKVMYDCHVGVVLTNNFFTSEAQQLARKNNVLLWDRRKLINMIEKAN